MAAHFMVFQHSPWEGPGLFFIHTAKQQGLTFDIINVWEQTQLPDPSSYDGLIVLGGGPNVDQITEYPFLEWEKDIIKEVVFAGRPYLGFCLGHQLLADVIGLNVGPNQCSSIGFVKGFLTADGRKHPVFEGCEKHFSMFKWHAQAVHEPVPSHIHILATSGACAIEAISVRDQPHIIGLQFDNHAAHPLDVEKWLEQDRDWLTNQPEGDIDERETLHTAQLLQDRMESDFSLFFRNYCKLIA